MKFVLEQAADPIPVRRWTEAGLLSDTVHLTDDREQTLCGKKGTLALAALGVLASCRTCLGSVNSAARVRRMFR